MNIRGKILKNIDVLNGTQCIHNNNNNNNNNRTQWHRVRPKTHFSIRMQLSLDALDSLGYSVFSLLFSFIALSSSLAATYMCLNRWHCKIKHIYIKMEWCGYVDVDPYIIICYFSVYQIRYAVPNGRRRRRRRSLLLRFGICFWRAVVWVVVCARVWKSECT